MSRRRISQREARAALARVKQLEARIEAERNAYALETPGTWLGKLTYNEQALICESAYTAARLGFAVVAKAWDDKKTIVLYAVPRKVD